MQQLMQRTLCMRPFKAARGSGRACGVSTRAAKTSLIRSVQADIKEKRRSAEDVTRQFLDNIARLEPTLNSFITVSNEQALQQVGLVAWDCSLSMSMMSMPWQQGVW